MNQQKYIIVKQYVGIYFLNYILNSKLDQDAQYESITFNESQVNILSSLYELIQTCRITFIKSGGFGDGTHFYLGQLIREHAQAWRASCGGQIESKKTDDEILNYLFEKAIEAYPVLIIKSSLDNSRMNFFSLGTSDYSKFINLVKNDVLDKLTNQQNDLDYRFFFGLSDESYYEVQISLFCTSLLSRAFQNCCNRMTYELNDFFKEISELVNSLRDLANDKPTTFSTFVGIRGAYFKDFKEIDLRVAKIRNVDSIYNPGIINSHVLCIHSEDEIGYLSGGVLEILNTVTKVPHPERGCYFMSSKLNEHMAKITQKVKLSFSFSVQSDYGIQRSYSESGFALSQVGNAQLPNRTPEYIVVNETHRKDIIEWFNLLESKNTDNLLVSLNRIEYAIYERNTPVDSLLDAFISWEGMFSEAFETTLKVTGSIAKFLYKVEDREIKFSRLKKLYNLRSDLAHGKNNKLLEKEDIHDLRKEVILIALECLKKLLKDDELLKLAASERVHRILIMRA